MSVVEFKDDDAAYGEWLSAHPEGYVLNTRREIDPNYVVLHRSTCGTISRPAEDGAYTSNAYMKIAGDLEALEDWARRRARGISKRCGLCNPGRT